MGEEKTIKNVVSPILDNSYAEVPYIDLLNDYKSHFHNKRVTLKTNYKKLSSFDVHFRETDLPHLMGWDKIVQKNISATNLIKNVNNGKLCLDSTKKHHRFIESKNRMINYPFIHEVFTKNDLKVCVMTRDMKPNSMSLDIVFFKQNNLGGVVLGLRKVNKMDHFVLTTLHPIPVNNAYNRRRRTSITSFEWK